MLVGVFVNFTQSWTHHIVSLALYLNTLIGHVALRKTKTNHHTETQHTHVQAWNGLNLKLRQKSPHGLKK